MYSYFGQSEGKKNLSLPPKQEEGEDLGKNRNKIGL
jgi:hypothetical protein